MKFRYTIKLLIAYPSKIFKWLVEGRFHNLTLIILAVTILYFFNIITYEPKIVSALFLVSGLTIIIWQMILDSMKFSKHKPNTPKNWIKKFPNFKPKTLSINVGSASTVETAGKIYAKKSIPLSSPLEDKVNFLMKQNEIMESAIINLDEKMDNKLSEVNKNIMESDRKIEETEIIINSVISEIAVGHYDLKLFSVVLMICGTFLQILI